MPLKEDGTDRMARKTANLPSHLVPLDPRHGVFCNLVMTPLFATGYMLAIERKGTESIAFFPRMSGLVSDLSERRFNLFENRPTKSKGRAREKASKSDAVPETDPTKVFEIDNDTLEGRIGSFNLDDDLWLVFGHQTNFGLLWWLLDKNEAQSTEKEKFDEFSQRFVKAVCECDKGIRVDSCSQFASRIGLLHRLCTGVDKEACLQCAVAKLEPKSDLSAGEITRILRHTVPLLHNEGYTDGRNPTGNAQSYFVRQASGTKPVGDLYWQVMGYAISCRVFGDYVE